MCKITHTKFLSLGKFYFAAKQIIPSTIWIRFATVCLSIPPLNSWTYFGPWSNRPRSCILLPPRLSYQSPGEWSPEVQKEIPQYLWDGHCECSPIELDWKNSRRSWKMCVWSVQQGKLTSSEAEKVSWKLDWKIGISKDKKQSGGKKRRKKMQDIIILYEADLQETIVVSASEPPSAFSASQV